MTNSIFPLLLAVLVVLSGCGDAAERASDRGAAFSEMAGEPVAVPVLQNTWDRSPDGRVARADIHVLFPATVDQASARATLQHMIDSVAAGDSTVASIRLAGFLIGRLDPATGEAEVEPAMVAIWSPIDTLRFTARRPETRFRTSITVVRPLPGDRQ